MDAISLLTADHDTVRDLFDKFRNTDDTDEQRHLQDMIFSELETHMRIEEDVFYPAVKELDVEELTSDVDESVQEHHVVKVLMREVAGLSDPDVFEAKMTVLIENVEHHAEEEEQKLFPDSQKALGDERMDELGVQLEARKASLEADDASRDELYAKAKDMGVEGRSDMTKDELASAVGETES
jgi:hemerythrin superfamily protein